MSAGEGFALHEIFAQGFGEAFLAALLLQCGLVWLVLHSVISKKSNVTGTIMQQRV